MLGSAMAVTGPTPMTVAEPPTSTPVAPPAPPPTPPPAQPPVQPPAGTQPAPPASGGGVQLPPGAKPIETETYPDDRRIEIVRRLLTSSNFDQAKMVLDTILKQRPDLGRAQFYMGVTLSKMKQYEQARPFLEQSVKGDQPFPERKHAHHFMAWASYHLGDLDRAKAEFQAHIALVGDEPDSIFALGLIAFDEDRLDDAEAKFQKAIDLQQGPKASKRDLAKAWARLGDVSMRRDQAAKAEEQFMQSLALYPDHYEVWAKLGRCRDRLGKVKEAESAREEEAHALERVRKRGGDVDDPTPAPNAPAPPKPDGAAPQQPPATTPATAPSTQPTPPATAPQKPNSPNSP
ncbi:MAG: tetratricopeptide repeat protein [Phycisphaerales bacterium]